MNHLWFNRPHQNRSRSLPRCKLSKHLFKIYPKKILQDALEGSEGPGKVGRITVISLQHAYDIVLTARSMHELGSLVTRVKLATKQRGHMLNTYVAIVMSMVIQGTIAT